MDNQIIWHDEHNATVNDGQGLLFMGQIKGIPGKFKIFCNNTSELDFLELSHWDYKLYRVMEVE